MYVRGTWTVDCTGTWMVLFWKLVYGTMVNDNLRELGVLESKRNTIRRGLVHELLNAQDTVLCSYFAQRSGARGEGRDRERTVEEAFQGLDYFE